MASRISLGSDKLLCPLCFEVFSLPVLLKCGHNSCRACLLKHWDRKGSRECPVCRSVSLSERPPINLELKIAADLFHQEATYENQGICLIHREKLNIFCQNDEEPICLVCQTSKQHKIHKCCPVDEAALEKRAEISGTLASLQKHLKLLNKTKEQWTETQTYVKTRANECEKAIQEAFEKLHRFLREEEKARLIRLRQEEEMKTKVMKEKLANIQVQITELGSIIQDTLNAMTAKNLPFLEEYKKTKKRAKCDIRQPECIRDMLIDSAEHLGLLGFRIWKKMAKLVRYAPFTLDPNTAQPNLRFSEELTQVQYGSKQLLPDNPERCNSRMCVLGATAFVSGKHCWTVDVGQGKNWYIGVARESIKRKDVVFLNPTEGFWVIGLCNGDTYWAQNSPRTRIVVKNKPKRIMVELDYDKGKVVFINAADFAVIHTFKDKFVEKLLPYFSPGMYEEEKTSSPLSICPLPLIIDVQPPKSQNS
ncbi:zinc-binding protein A33-like [Genypterus blacodes]|uniref:zinc-binding protein A33-like n=1 Tax=Genypterus blacodes TaxID=154954 RepID=UPI003F757A15